MERSVIFPRTRRGTVLGGGAGHGEEEGGEGEDRQRGPPRGASYKYVTPRSMFVYHAHRGQQEPSGAFSNVPWALIDDSIWRSKSNVHQTSSGLTSKFPAACSRHKRIDKGKGSEISTVMGH